MRAVPVLIIFLLAGCSNSLNEKKIKAPSLFAMDDKLMCTVVQSSDKADIGKNFALIGLSSAKPEALFETTGSYPLIKTFENDRTLSLALRGPSRSGGFDNFIIDKNSGKFSRVSAGLIEIAGVFAVASLGICK